MARRSPYTETPLIKMILDCFSAHNKRAKVGMAIGFSLRPLKIYGPESLEEEI